MTIRDFFPKFMDYGMVFNRSKRDKPRHLPTPGKRDSMLEDDMCISLYNALEYNNSSNRNSKGTNGIMGEIRKKQSATQVNCLKHLQYIYISWM